MKGIVGLVSLPLALPVLPLHTAVRHGVVKARSDYQSEIGWPAYVRLVEQHPNGVDVIVADNSAKQEHSNCSAAASHRSPRQT